MTLRTSDLRNENKKNITHERGWISVEDQTAMTKRRVHDVFGSKSYRRMVVRCVNCYQALHDAGRVFVFGGEDDRAIFNQALNEVAGTEIKPLYRAETKAADDFPVIASLGDKAITEETIHLVNYGREGDPARDLEEIRPRSIKIVVVLYPSEEEEKYLGRLLSETDVEVYTVQPLDHDNPHRDELVPRENIPGFEQIPDEVDFEAVDAPDAEISPLPAVAMYGKCAEIARMTHAPLGFAYPAIVAAVAPSIVSNANIRSTMYVFLLGDVHTGKSVARERTIQLLGLKPPILVSNTPASDRGLLKLFPKSPLDAQAMAHLLDLDEAREMFSKGSIENSTLISTLCKLWSSDTAGVVDKKGIEECQVRLSIVGAIKAKDETEFPSVFTHATAHGLYDRGLYGFRGPEKWHFTPWEFDAERDTVKLSPSVPNVSGSIFDLKRAWEQRGDGRERLAEIALRVAYITSAANGDRELTAESLETAFRLMEWQEQIRAVFQPAKGSNEAQECANTVCDTFRAAPGRALNWREASRKHNWHRRFPRTLPLIKKNLVADGILVFHKDSGKYYINEGPSKEKQNGNQ
jgi:hypothetical protein